MTARDTLARMHAQIKNGDYQAANTFAWAAIAEALVQMVEPAPTPGPVVMPTPTTYDEAHFRVAIGDT